MTQSATAWMKLEEDVKQKLINDCVCIFLAKSQNGAVVRQQDITEGLTLANPGDKKYSRFVSEILNGASAKFKTVFGMDICQLGDKKTRPSKTGRKKAAAKQQKLYILTNALEHNPADRAQIVDFSDDHHNIALVFVILAYIYLNDQMITHSQLWVHLEKLGLHASEKRHPLFGDVTKLYKFDLLVKQRWLDMCPVKVDGRDDMELRWGQRAEKELDARDVIGFLANLIGQDKEPYVKEYLRKKRHREQMKKQQQQGEEEGIAEA
ncbi:hypothetical protein SARC_01158 [Sphaeroforma arctica JP610]|uniref:MAGE domain-containing protein n=1 Tax=Sphaeroforma arctica JP610 TaxID=667725 RepID=A0A0L0GCF4_9EUKA|nr:hypothetical protein SARC_01158 [Sphaeroforma arctica JP610]KNC86690.1 hypothetical protein SARC_01158 [Sphaeroforma arctica JP610]|eukprot:XP_014160592.1 hypothetical protein SARC_01158 [Sphaeroforma arctica JP610]